MKYYAAVMFEETDQLVDIARCRCGCTPPSLPPGEAVDNQLVTRLHPRPTRIARRTG